MNSGNTLRINPVAYAVSVALTGSYAPAALAQTQPQATGLDAVIVTARKREETLLDIPQEIQAITQQQLERANLDTIKEFSRFVPSLSYNATVPGRGTIYFRGVADDSSSFIADASAAIYLDEQPLTQSALQPEIRLIDIERIEALPGPQGTLYGSSSQSGTLRYITNKPDAAAFTTDVTLDASTMDHGDEGYEVSGVVNVPLGENVAIRVVGFSARDAGFIDNVLGTSLDGSFDNAGFVDNNVNSVEYSGGRAALRWKPNEKWTVDGSVVYQQMDANSYSEDDVRRSGREYAVVRFLDESRSDEWTQLGLTLQGDLGWAQFTSSTSYFTRRIAYFQDNTDYTFYLSHSFGANYAVYDLGPDPHGLGWRDGPFVDRIAQEFRLQGSTEKLAWVAGLFYEKVEEGFNFFSRIENYEDTPGFAARSYYAVYYGLDPLEPGSTDNAFYHSKNNQKTEQYAAFGEVTYSPNEDWSFTAGLRWFDHTRTRDYFTQQPNGNFTSNLGTAKNSTSDITKKLSVQYNINDNAMVYALYSDGFRAGGRNVVRPGTVLPADYDADFLDNYELGFKSRFAGGKYTVNLTAFKMEWKDYQIEVVDPGPLFAILVANVGDAEIEGVSLDFSAYLFDSLDIGLNLQLLDPKTKANEPLLGLLPGDRLPFSAEEKGGIWVEYTFPREFAGGNFYARYQFSYMGNSLNGLPTPVLDDDGNVVEIVEPTLQPAYQISDFKIGLAADHWEVYAYVDNMFDERAIYFDQFTEIGLKTNNTKTIGDPRTFGIGFTKSWGGQLTTGRRTAPKSKRVRVERMRKRGHYDRETIDAILDAGLVCHVGFVHQKMPVVIPTLYWREGDHVYLHGSAVSRMLDTARKAPVCVTVTHVDGLVLTRSAFHHSMNYRSVVVLGEPEEVTDAVEKEKRLRTFMEGLMPGRWDGLRPVKPKELKATRLLRLEIDEASAKIRAGPPADDKADYTWPSWGGIIPIETRVGAPQPDEHVKEPNLRPPRVAKFRPS